MRYLKNKFLYKIRMLYYERSEVSEGIYVSESKDK